MRYAVVENNTITNIIELDDASLAEQFNAVLLSDIHEFAEIGMSVDGNNNLSGDDLTQANEMKDAAKEAEVREERNRLLAAQDYYMLTDAPFSEEAVAEIAAYRQALRDITSQEGFPYNVVWPVIREDENNSDQ
jgi:hypothetical protein